MKNLFLLFALLASLVTIPAASAASLQIGGTFRLEQNLPLQGSLALEQSGIRLWGAAGDDKLFSFGADILRRESNGLYAGLGATIDYSPAESYSYYTSDTTSVSRKHDNGRHVGDKNNPHPSKKRKVTIEGNIVTVEHEEDFDAKLGVVTGWSAPQGPFIENRIVIDTYGDITARATVGLRF
jgi:hypothetical protein